MRHVLLTMLLVFFSLGIGFSVEARAPSQGENGQTLVQAVNLFRAANGRPAYTIHPALMAAAQSHVNWMAATGNYGHVGEGGSTIQGRATAAGYQGFVFENWTTGSDVSQAISWWAGSSIHRANMLRNVVHIGAGVAPGGSGNLYVIVVGSPSEYAPAPPGGAVDGPAGDSGSSSGEAGSGEDAAPAVVMAPVVVATPDENGNVIHVVQDGQTAWAIASRYEVPLDDLLALNGLDRSSLLWPGDELLVKLGEGQEAPTPPPPPTEHIVQEGEDLWTIAVSNGLALDDLLALNGLVRGDIIQPGDVLKLREPEPTATPSPSPTVLPTETPLPPTATWTPTVTTSPTVTIEPGTPTPTVHVATVTPRGVAFAPTVEPTQVVVESRAPGGNSDEGEGLSAAGMMAIGAGVLGMLALGLLVWGMVGGRRG